MTKLKIKVTKEILDESKWCSYNMSSNCAIACAIREIFPRAIVGYSRISIFVPGKQWPEYVALPVEAQHFVREFDKSTAGERAAMSEIEFEIELPGVVVEMINIDEVKEILKTSKTLELKGGTNGKPEIGSHRQVPVR
jgi:hypothetical protein